MHSYISKLLLIQLLQSTLLGKYKLERIIIGSVAHGNTLVVYIECFLHLSLTGVKGQGLQLLDTSNRCLYPGDTLIYECTVMGEPGGSTAWTGNIFNCANHEISLFHADYGFTEGAYGECGDIVGYSVRIDMNTMNDNSTSVSHYTSRLTVPVNSGTVGRTIECYYDNGTIATMVGRETVNITIGIKNTMDNNINNNFKF